MSLAAPLEAPATVLRNSCAHDCPDRRGMLSRVVEGRLIEVEKVAPGARSATCWYAASASSRPSSTARKSWASATMSRAWGESR